MDQAIQNRFDRKLAELFQSEKLPQKVAVAVSGGSDSMALALLLKQWCAQNSIHLAALTVDHRLRPEAAAEADLVGQWLKDYQIEHFVLKGSGEAPSKGVQEYARDLRYTLISETCRSQKIDHLFVGHQMEDLQETFLMRLSKGSGLNGLTSLSPLSENYGLQIVRPLLEFQRSELRAYLQNSNQDWIEDPSNENPVFTRTAVGNIQKSLVSLSGATQNSFQLSIKRLSRSNAALEHYVRRFWGECVIVSEFGFFSVSLSNLLKEPDEIIVRVLGGFIQGLRGHQFRVKLSDLEKLLTQFSDKEVSALDFTLSGCRVLLQEDELTFFRERGRTGLEKMVLDEGTDWIWDHRFYVQLGENSLPVQADEKLEIREIGAAGWRQIQEYEIRSEIHDLPVFVRNSLPAVFKGAKVVAAPLFLGGSGQSGIAMTHFEMLFLPLR